MKYSFKFKLGLTLMIGLMFFASCYEPRYYRRYHHHTRPWYERRHMPPPPGVDFRIDVR